MKPGRLFVSRLLNELRGMDRNRRYRVNKQAKKDILWWRKFLPEFPGSSILWLLDVAEVDSELAVDACLRAAGGYRGNEYFRVEFPKDFSERHLKITHLEMWAVIVAVRLWGSELTGKIIRIRSDNEAVTTIINTGRSYDLRLQAQLR